MLCPDDEDLRPLGWARAAFGAVFLLRTTALLAPLDPIFLRGGGPLAGWPDGAWHASMGGLALPAAVVAALCILRTAAAVALALGWQTRAAGLIAGSTGYLVLAQDAFAWFHHLHMLYLGAILFGLTDAGTAAAVRPPCSPPRSPRTSLALLRTWVASIYLWAALSKLRPDWLDGRALALFHAERALDGALADALLATPARCAAAAWTVALLELALGPALLWRRTRVAALGAAGALHALFELVGRVDTIGWQMAALLVVFVPLRARRPPHPPATR